MIIHVKVRPGSKEEKIERVSESEFIVNIKERAEKGKANESLVRLLAKEFGVSSKDVLIKNPSSRKKVIEIKL